VYGSEIGRQVFSASGKASLAELELFGSGGALNTVDIKRLTGRVKAAKSWREVVDVMESAQKMPAEQLDDVFVSAVLSTLPKLIRRADRKLTDAEKASVTSAVQALVRSQLQPRLAAGELDAQGVVTAAVGLAKLSDCDMYPSQPDLSQLLQQLAAHSVGHMRAGRMSGQGLSNFAWALAACGVRPPSSWLSEFYARVEEQMGSLNGQDIANIFWAVCRLELMPPWVTGSMPGIMGHAVRCVAGADTGQDPATILVCLAIWSRSFSYRPPDAKIQGLLNAMHPQLAKYAPQDLVSCVHSLVVLNISPSRAWMTTFYVVLRDRLVSSPTLSYADFQRLLWALSRIDFTPSQAWLRNFVEVSIGKLAHLRFRALSELIWSLACWGYTPTPEWLREYYRVTLPQLRHYKPQHLANSIVALKKLGCKVPAAWLEAALGAFCAQLADARAHDLVAFLDGIVDVCEDAAWMSAPATGTRLRDLAEFSSTKFEICDPVMHAKLLVALVTAKCYPSGAWLSKQQDSLTRSLAVEELEPETASDLRNAYAALSADISPSLAQELGARESTA